MAVYNAVVDSEKAIYLAFRARLGCAVPPPPLDGPRSVSKPGATMIVEPREILSLRLFPGTRRPQGVGDEELHKYSSRRVQYSQLAGPDIAGTLTHAVVVSSGGTRNLKYARAGTKCTSASPRVTLCDSSRSSLKCLLTFLSYSRWKRNLRS